MAAARAVRKRVGDRVTAMCDYNQRLTAKALERGRLLDGERLHWIEEPSRHDDYAARRGSRPNSGRRSRSARPWWIEMVNALQAKAMDYVMPDVQRIGGVTGWLRAAAIAQAHGIEMSSHLFSEYSAHLLAVTPTAHWLEHGTGPRPCSPSPSGSRMAMP